MDESYEEESQEEQYKPSFVLIAIDTDEAMFIKRETDGGSPFKDCLNACYKVANSLLFTKSQRKWCPFAIVFAREDASAGFVNFSDNIIQTIKLLQKEIAQSHDSLRTSYHRKANLDLSAFFLFCKKKLKEINSVFAKKTMIYISNDDDPTRGVKSQRFAAINEIKDFEINSISFELLTMNTDFSYKKFYNELFSVLKVPQVENIVEDEEGVYDKLSSSIVNKLFKRNMFFYPFLKDTERFLQVVQTSHIKEEKLETNAYISKATDKKLKKIIKSESDGMAKYTLEGPEKIEFSPEERLETLDSELPVGYSLICVSKRLSEVGIVVKDSLLLGVHPEEDLPYFNEFWQYCVNKNKVLICLRKLRTPDKLRFVELLPKFINGQKVFIINSLPYSNEFCYPDNRQLDEVESVPCTDTKRETINKLIDALTFDFSPNMFCDPALAKKKAYIKSKLLDCPKEEVSDFSVNYSAIDKALDDLAQTFTNLYELDEQEVKPSKRKAPSTSKTTKRKK